MTIETTNRHPSGGASFSFEAALHTYLRVADIEKVRIAGLTGRPYIDKVDAMKRKVEQAKTLTIAGETDRVYQQSPDTCIVRDTSPGRETVVEKEGSQSTVVWNPWIDKAKRLKDLGDDEWRRFVCVETANVGEHAVTLAPGEAHRMGVTLRSISS
jgi:glucose-6-phosphate 1-epimerase